jgi:hypothetical protein
VTVIDWEILIQEDVLFWIHPVVDSDACPTCAERPERVVREFAVLTKPFCPPVVRPGHLLVRPCGHRVRSAALVPGFPGERPRAVIVAFEKRAA